MEGDISMNILVDVMEIKRVKSITWNHKHVQKREVMVGWNFQPFGWHKINIDKAIRRLNNEATCGGIIKDYIRRLNNEATCGGIIKDYIGNFVNGFNYRIGYCLVLKQSFRA